MHVIIIDVRRDGNVGTIGKINAKGIDRDRPLAAKGGRFGQERATGGSKGDLGGRGTLSGLLRTWRNVIKFRDDLTLSVLPFENRIPRTMFLSADSSESRKMCKTSKEFTHFTFSIKNVGIIFNEGAEHKEVYILVEIEAKQFGWQLAGPSGGF